MEELFGVRGVPLPLGVFEDEFGPLPFPSLGLAEEEPLFLGVSACWVPVTRDRPELVEGVPGPGLLLLGETSEKLFWAPEID